MVVAVEEAGNKIGIALAVGEALGEAVQHAHDRRIRIRNDGGIVAVGALCGDLVGMKTEEEHVLVAQPFVHLYIGAVQRSDGHSAVHHQLHAAGTGGLLAGGRDLLGDIGGGNDSFRSGHAVVFHKADLQLVLAGRILVDVVLHGEEQLDDAFGCLVACSRLGTEDIGARQKFHIGIVAQLQLKIRNAHGAEELPLVLVQTLDLDIDDGIRIQNKTAVVACQESGKARFVVLLDSVDPFQNDFVIFISAQSGEIFRVKQIRISSKQLADECVKTGIDLPQPAAMVDAVGDIGKRSGRME